MCPRTHPIVCVDVALVSAHSDGGGSELRTLDSRACSTQREQNVLAQPFESLTSVFPCFQLLSVETGGRAPLFLPSKLLRTLSYDGLR